MPALADNLDNPVKSEKTHFFGLMPSAFDALAQQWKWPPVRSKQVPDWVYNKLVAQPQEMSNLSKLQRQTLPQHVLFNSAAILRRQDSNDGTIKLLLAWPPDDHSLSESPLTGVQNCLSLRNQAGQGSIDCGCRPWLPPSIHSPPRSSRGTRDANLFVTKWSPLGDFMDATWR